MSADQLATMTDATRLIVNTILLAIIGATIGVAIQWARSQIKRRQCNRRIFTRFR